jgi:hypothetical protein
MTPIKNIIFVLLLLLSIKTLGQSDFKLQKIYFYVSPNCFGICDEYYLVVDSNRMVKLHAVQVIKKDTELEHEPKKEGYFSGQLSSKEYKKLINLIIQCDIERLTDFGVSCCDGQKKKMVISYNNKVKTFETMHPKGNFKFLVDYIYYIIEKKGYKRTSETW